MMVSTLFHLVQKAHARHTVFIDLAPHGLTLQLHARHAVKNGHEPVEDPQTALHFQRDIHVSGDIDDVGAVILLLACGGGGNDGDDALLLVLYPVHGGAALIDMLRGM